MREEGLIVICKRRRKYNSYKGEISRPVPNKIERDFHADKPKQKWLTDITEFALPAGKVYLSALGVHPLIHSDYVEEKTMPKKAKIFTSYTA